MSDLVERLRGDSYSLPSNGEWIERNGDTLPNNSCSEAADELERKDAAIAELVGALKTARSEVMEMCWVFKVPTPDASLGSYDALIAKHKPKQEGK